MTKKVGTAVQRNRIKRVVREVFRRHRSMFPAGHDVVFIAGMDVFRLYIHHEPECPIPAGTRLVRDGLRHPQAKVSHVQR